MMYEKTVTTEKAKYVKQIIELHICYFRIYDKLVIDHLNHTDKCHFHIDQKLSYHCALEDTYAVARTLEQCINTNFLNLDQVENNQETVWRPSWVANDDGQITSEKMNEWAGGKWHTYST